MLMKVDLEFQSSGWWNRQFIKMISSATLDQGGLLKVDHKIQEGGNSYWISGERQNGALWCLTREIISKKEKEEGVVVGLALSAAATQIPYAGLALNALSLMSDSEGYGDLRIPLELFDTTAMELPGFLVKYQKGLPHQQIRVLYTAELDIRPVAVRSLGTHTLRLGDREFSCQKYALASKGDRCTLWVARDRLGDFRVKETGIDKEGAYEMILIAYERGNPL